MRPRTLLAIAVATLSVTTSARADPGGATASTTPAEDAPPPRPDLVFLADPNLGMEGGTRTIESLGRIVFRYDEALPTLVELDETRPASKVAAVLGRGVKLLFLDDPLATFEAAVIHEVFGHGARARELGGGASYRFSLPGVYCAIFSTGSDTCVSTAHATTRPGVQDQALAFTFGGLESNYLTAWWLNAHLVQTQGWMHHGDLLVYLRSKNAYATSFVFDGALGSPGAGEATNDVHNYVTELQDRFNRWRPEDRSNIARRLQTAYLWNLADPTLLFAAYGTVVDTLFHGKRMTRLPLPSIGGTYVYPVPRFNLSPFGAEHYVDVFFGRGGAVLDVYGRVGSSGLASYTGGGLRVLGWKPARAVGLGAELDVWDQPEVLPDVRGAYDRPNRFGVNVGALMDIGVIERVGVTARLAYKTSGYLMGQPLAEGVHGYVGLRVTP